MQATTAVHLDFSSDNTEYKDVSGNVHHATFIGMADDTRVYDEVLSLEQIVAIPEPATLIWDLEASVI